MSRYRWNYGHTLRSTGQMVKGMVGAMEAGEWRERLIIAMEHTTKMAAADRE